jgi:hypothetical protein
MDAFAVEAYQAVRPAAGQDADLLAREIRRAVARAGGAFVAACGAAAGSDSERAGLETARSGLLEAHYQIYLARRLGLSDLRRYRTIAARHEIALREIDALLAPPPAGREPP